MCQIPNIDENLISYLCEEEVAFFPGFGIICSSVSCCYMRWDVLSHHGFDLLQNAFLE